MISNPQIFAYESGNTHPSLELMLPIAQLIGRWANSWFGVGEDRFI